MRKRTATQKARERLLRAVRKVKAQGFDLSEKALELVNNYSKSSSSYANKVNNLLNKVGYAGLVAIEGKNLTPYEYKQARNYISRKKTSKKITEYDRKLIKEYGVSDYFDYRDFQTSPENIRKKEDTFLNNTVNALINNLPEHEAEQILWKLAEMGRNKTIDYFKQNSDLAEAIFYYFQGSYTTVAYEYLKFMVDDLRISENAQTMTPLEFKSELRIKNKTLSIPNNLSSINRGNFNGL